RNASLASGHVRDYLVAFVVELAERYPIDGIRLDWPEAPPYDLGSALFDFHPAMRRLMQDEGHDDVAVARDVAEWVRGLRAAASRAAPEGPQAVRRALVDAGWEAWSSEDGVYQPLRSAKRRAITGLLT